MIVPCIPVRYQFTFLAFVGIVFNYALRVNINLVITNMVNQTALDIRNNVTSSTDPAKDGPFVWDSVVTGDIVGMFFAGYMVFQMLGGRVAEISGGKRVLAVSMTGVSVLTLLIPVAAKLSGEEGYPYALVVIRVFMGLFEASAFPCVTSMLARWAPEQERSTMSTLIMAGSQVGTIVGFFLSGILSDAWGWESVFYIEGGLCFVWILLWFLLVADTPSTHPRISASERDFIISNLPATASETLPIPWLAILTSLPFWAILVGNVGNNWGFHLLIAELPQYLKKIFPEYMKDSTTVGIWSAVPYATMWACSIVFSITSDYLIRTNKLSTAVVRKSMQTISQLGPAICLLVLGLYVSNENKADTLTLTLAMFTTAVGALGALYSGWITNPQDIAPNFAGTILGLTNCAGSIPGFVSPAVASAIINDDETNTDKWRTVWLICVGILVLDTVIFVVFADGKPQSWNAPKEKKKEEGRDWFLVVFTVGVALIGATYAGVTMGLHG